MCSPHLAGWCLVFPGLLWRGPAAIAGGHRELAVKSFETEVAQSGKLIVQSSQLLVADAQSFDKRRLWDFHSTKLAHTLFTLFLLF